MDANNHTTTVFGLKSILVKHEDGREENLQVRQFKLREYQSLFPLIEDEIGLCARAVGKTRAGIETLLPESYELLHRTMKEVNEKGFFIFATRRLERGAMTLRSLPPEMLEKVMAAGAKIMGGAPSSTPSPTLPPPVA